MPVAAVALSGGVDSLVAALRLRAAGHSLLGIHFLTGFETAPPDSVRGLADRLEIPFHEIDLTDDFRRSVVDDFVETYRRGRTPNPCMVCNPRIKFGRLLEEARKRGADLLATGHYARIVRDEEGRVHLLRGADRKKDQSYFLARVPGNRLAAAVFPLGDLTKDRVREMAAEAGFSESIRSESQDICFVRDNYADFLAAAGAPSRPGEIVALDGTVIGRHEGLHRYTVGQRKGIGVPGPQPYYVARLDREGNRLVVGGKAALRNFGCRVASVNWIIDPPENRLETRVRVRHRHQAAPARVTPLPGNRAEVQFETPQSAVTPGQGAVFYRDEEVLGGGVIEEAW
ncbi:MAG: tRNA 2-thiouridine(34) synthase MnmA [Desulfococcaceae bacterium]